MTGVKTGNNCIGIVINGKLDSGIDILRQYSRAGGLHQDDVREVDVLFLVVP